MKDKITCPNCGHSFDVEEAISGKLEAHFKSEYERKVAEQIEKFNAEKKKLEEERNIVAEQKEKQEELLKKELSKALEIESKKIEKLTSESYEETIKSLKEENEKRKSENKTLREKEVALMRQEAELKEKQEDLYLQVEKQILEKQKEIEDKARAKERESFELEKIKLLKQIEDNKKLAEEMKRKAEQGSMQLQGEVQELAIEDLLSKTYPFDKIQEVPKGVRGADCIQTVINSIQQECGSIVYESKRTKNYSNDWIDKLKQDQVTCKADLAVLVTEAMPGDMDRFGERNGVWICGFHEVRGLSFVLREMLIKTQSVKISQENKGDKMELLYTYLTSNEFVQNIKRIVENYDDMVVQLNSEKKAMYKIWALREKQIWAVQENVSALFGAIKGIAGKEMETSNVLQLPDNQIE
ncbi:DUF2130 domain-containing protein [candidate division WOR-3 bacterium]|nr:DUF2130 domain-containing protein [candidate division WOR-3 bacterium]